MREFDYSFLKGDHSNQVFRLSSLITDINAEERIRKIQYEYVFDALKKKALIDSAVGSSAIEGILTSDKRLKEIFVNKDPMNHDEFEILGYKDALDYIHEHVDDIDIDEDTICHLHFLIEKDADPFQAGKYKNTDNFILEFHSDKTRSVRFVPIGHKETKQAVKQLLLAYYDARQDEEIDPLLLSFCFVLDFTCIHPFSDGNGRVSRLLTLLLLYKAGYDIGKYISIEKQINKYKEQYYQALQSSSQRWHENKNDYSAFEIFMMQIMYRCYQSLNDSFGELTFRKNKKNERIRMVLENSLVPVSKMQIKELLPDVSIRTIEAELKRLMNENKIRKIGSYKDARYLAVRER